MCRHPLSPNKIFVCITKVDMNYWKEIGSKNNVKLTDKSKFLVLNVNSNVKIQKEAKLVDVSMSLFTSVTEDFSNEKNCVLTSNYDG